MSWAAALGGFRHPADLAHAGHVNPHLTALFSGRLQMLNILGVTAWFAAFVYFWRWWLDPAHVMDWPCYILITVVVGWITLLPVYFMGLVMGFRKRDRFLPIVTVSALASVAGMHLVGSPWHVSIGALAGIVLAACLPQSERTPAPRVVEQEA